MTNNDKKLNGAALIAAERRRHVEEEGFDSEHDDDHCGNGDLLRAAVCLAAPVTLFAIEYRQGEVVFRDPWPKSWSEKWDKRRESFEEGSDTVGSRIRHPLELDPTERMDLLVKAGSLIAAQIDVMIRSGVKVPDRYAAEEGGDEG